MVKIFTAYGDEKPKKIPNKPGNIMEPQYKERYDENGNAYLEQVGEINTYEKIQSYKDEVDPMSILARYAAGDTTVMANPGWYIDTSKLPANSALTSRRFSHNAARFAASRLRTRSAIGSNAWKLSSESVGIQSNTL